MAGSPNASPGVLHKKGAIDAQFPWRYDAFISYSQIADGGLAIALRKGLHLFAKPWNRLRAVNVFLDGASLGVSASLPAGIAQALEKSRFLVLLASPGAAASSWVNDEIRIWLAKRGADDILIVLTDGEIVWNAHNGDYDRALSTALPPSLLGTFRTQPRHLDLRWARGRDNLSLRTPEFRAAIADLAASVRNIPKEDLLGDDVVQHTRARTLRNGAFAALLALILALGVASVVAMQQRDIAAQQDVIALSARARAQTETGDATRGMLLALAAAGRPRVAGTPAARQAEWALLNAVLNAHERRILLHADTVMAVCFSPSGADLLTASLDGAASVWQVDTGERRFALVGHAGPIYDAAYSADGARIVTASKDRTARVWDARTGREIAQLKDDGGTVWSARFSPDGARVVTAADGGNARIWDLATGAVLHVLAHDGPVISAAFSPDGAHVVSASDDQTARVWDARTGASVAVLRHPSYVKSAVFSPDGRTILTAAQDGAARLWDATTGASLMTFAGHDKEVGMARFSADGRRVATAGFDETARVWDVASASSLFVLRGHQGEVVSASFSRDGKYVLTASHDGTARLWLAATGELASILAGHSERLRAAEFSPDGTRVATASADHTARIWDVAAAAPQLEIPSPSGPLRFAAYSSNGACVVTTTDAGARVWNARTGTPVIAVAKQDGRLWSAAFSPD